MCGYFRFFVGVPRAIVPDNLTSGVHKTTIPINRRYGMMAAHSGVGVLPAGPREPRDKVKAEAGMDCPGYILGRVRHQTFFSLAECNAAIASCLERMNVHVMRRLATSRRDFSIERPSLPS
jgi:transposase